MRASTTLPLCCGGCWAPSPSRGHAPWGSREVLACEMWQWTVFENHFPTFTHQFTYYCTIMFIYLYVCLCVNLCATVYGCVWRSEGNFESRFFPSPCALGTRLACQAWQRVSFPMEPTHCPQSPLLQWSQRSRPLRSLYSYFPTPSLGPFWDSPACLRVSVLGCQNS